MAEKVIPEKYLYVCDGCGGQVEQSKRYRPKHWSELKILCDAYDYQGMAVADGSIHRLLCGQCSDKAAAAIRSALKKAL